MGRDMYSQTRLFKRNNNYYYRSKIPVDLQEHFGKKEQKFSLKTKNREKAAALVRQIAAKSDEEFARLRAALYGEFREITRVDEEFIQEIRSLYQYAVLQGDESIRQDKERHDLLEMYMDVRPETMIILRKALATSDTEKIKQPLAVFLLINKITLDCSQEEYEKLAHEFLKEVVLTHEKQIARDEGYVIESPEHPVQPVGSSVYKRVSWADLLEHWEKDALNRPNKTVMDVTFAVKQLRKLLDDKQPGDVVAEDIEAFRDYLFDAEGLEYATVRKKVRFISTLFQVAVDKKILKENPGSRIKIPKPKFKKRRLPYDADDLEKIFSCPLFTEQKRPKGGGGEAAVWLPRLALYSGSRIEELAQLRVKDVCCERGIWYFNITAETENKKELTSLKNEASIRKLPIHSKILEAGFLEYFEKIKAGNHIRLFPEIRPYEEKISHNWSKWWGRYAREHIGITDKNKVFHSFRHTFKDACREAEISEELSDALSGHASTRGNTTARSYGKGHSLKKLHSAMERIEYPGLEIIFEGES